MGPDQIRGAYVLYIGAGAVAAGGMVSLLRTRCPDRAEPARRLRRRVQEAREQAGGTSTSTLRTDLDLSPKLVLIGALGLVAIITFAAPLHMNARSARS